MRKSFLLLVLVLLFLNVVSALDMNANLYSNVMVRGVDNSVKMTLNVNDATHGVYNVYTLSDLAIYPNENFEVVLDGNFKKYLELRTRQPFSLKGKYAFTYTLNYRGFEKYDKKTLIDFIDLEDVIFIGSDPVDSESEEITFYVKNLKKMSLNNLTARFSSNLFDITKTFSLNPEEQLEISVPVDVDELKKTKAGVYIINSVFETSVGDVKIDGNLYLGEKKGITSVETKSGLLIRTNTITKVNVGNVMENVNVEIDYNIISRFFTTFNVKPISIERDGFNVKYTFEKERLSPADAYIVKAKTNYVLPFFILIFLIVIIFMLKKYLETKVEVKKSVQPVKTKNGEFALKIELSVKARQEIENVVLSDRVPAMVRIYNKFGSVAPNKIDSKTRRLHWYIGSLKVGEVRVFNYIVYSKVGIVGKFILPEARVAFEKNKKKQEMDSNKIFFMNDQI